MGPRDQAQVVRLGGKNLYQAEPSHQLKTSIRLFILLPQSPEWLACANRRFLVSLPLHGIPKSKYKGDCYILALVKLTLVRSKPKRKKCTSFRGYDL